MLSIIAGLYRGHRLLTPKGKQTRPTSNRLRESLFNICQHKIEGSHFLDLFAGSGAIGLEALSRGASSATLIDSHKDAITCIHANIAKLHLNAEVLPGDIFLMLHLLEKKKKLFDIIYVDPPYNTPIPKSNTLYSSAVIQWIDSHQILAPNGLLFIEESLSFSPPPVHTLQCLGSRRIGQSLLQQYQLKPTV